MNFKKLNIVLLFVFLLISNAEGHVITVSSVRELMATSGPGQADDLTVLIQEGTYTLPGRITIDGNRVTYKGLSADPEKVVLRGKGIQGKVRNVFSVQGSRVYIQNMSLGEVANHAIQIHGENGAHHIFLQNLKLFDTGEQMLKGSFDPKTPDQHADYGLVEGCSFEFTDGYATQGYTGGIDIHRGENWVIKDNLFKYIRTRNGELTEGAIHFWNDARHTRILGNTILYCDRGIMLGFDQTSHTDGTIRGNLIHTTKDTGIYLCNATGIEVTQNTVLVDGAYPNAIEVRFRNSRDIQIYNNTVNRAIVARNGGQAQVFDNQTDKKNDWTVALPRGSMDLRLGREPVPEFQSILRPQLSLSEETAPPKKEIDTAKRAAPVAKVSQAPRKSPPPLPRKAKPQKWTSPRTIEEAAALPGLDPAQLTYEGSAIVPMMGQGALEAYKRTGYSTGRISWGQNKLWITSHAYSHYIHALELPGVIAPVTSWNKEQVCTPLGAWISPTGTQTGQLLSQIPASTAKQIGQVMFMDDGRIVTPFFDTYNVSGRNDPCFAIQNSEGQVKGLFPVEGQLANSHRICEYGLPLGKSIFVGAQGMAGQAEGSWGPAAYVIDLSSGKTTLSARCLLFYPKASARELLPNPASNWNGMALVGSTLIFAGNIATGKQGEDWDYGKPPKDACSSGKGYWTKKYDKILALYHIGELLKNRGEPSRSRPYAQLHINKTFADSGGDCGTISGMAFDGERLILCEPQAIRKPGAYENTPMLHIFNTQKN